MDRVTDKACKGSEVPLRAFWCKARVRGDRPLMTSHLERTKNCDASCVYGKVNIS